MLERKTKGGFYNLKMIDNQSTIVYFFLSFYVPWYTLVYWYVKEKTIDMEEKKQELFIKSDYEMSISDNQESLKDTNKNHISS